MTIVGEGLSCVVGVDGGLSSQSSSTPEAVVNVGDVWNGFQLLMGPSKGSAVPTVVSDLIGGRAEAGEAAERAAVGQPGQVLVQCIQRCNRGVETHCHHHPCSSFVSRHPPSVSPSYFLSPLFL